MRGHSAILHHLQSELIHVLFPTLNFYHLQSFYLDKPHCLPLSSEVYHESWIFPAGVSFALKQNMYWDGFCAFLPDISGLWGGGGKNM